LVASELSSVDGEFSAADDDVNEVHQLEGTQNNPANDKDKLSEVASNGVDCEEDGTSLSNDSDETESEEDYPVIKVTKPNVSSFSSNESPDNDKNYSLNDADDDNDYRPWMIHTPTVPPRTHPPRVLWNPRPTHPGCSGIQERSRHLEWDSM
jgi:hypothetical protein